MSMLSLMIIPQNKQAHNTHIHALTEMYTHKDYVSTSTTETKVNSFYNRISQIESMKEAQNSEKVTSTRL